MALGGVTLNRLRAIWWTFVSSSLDRIEAEKAAWKTADWQTGRFRLPPGDDADVIAITPELERLRLKWRP